MRKKKYQIYAQGLSVGAVAVASLCVLFGAWAPGACFIGLACYLAIQALE